MRYTYQTSKSRDRLEMSLEDSLARGDVSMGERPRIEPVRDHNGRVTHYVLTLEG